ncbi:sialidase family protein [Salibacterium salarium]|nr:sialidase family protein [Salibacterium salarium]
MSVQPVENKIPTLFPHNHASNIISLRNGDLMCVWFGGSREGKSDISILCSRLKKGGHTWSEPVILSSDSTRSEQNPILFENPNGELWLVFTAQDSIHQDSAVVRYRTSSDDGITWSDEKTLFDTPGSFVRHPPIILETGEIILPAYYSIKSDTGFLGKDYSVVKISNDNGESWNEYPVNNSKSLVHMSIVEGSNNKLIGFFRSRKADNIYVSISEDYGKTWSTPEKTSLLNNNSSIQCKKLNNGNLAMVFNNVNADLAPPEVNSPPWFDEKDRQSIKVNQQSEQESIWGVIRSPLTIAISEDEGKNWSYVKNIATADKDKKSPEFSYPSIYQTEEGAIHITYTYLRQCIKHTVISENWVKN